jgi:hypothetical protein
MGINCVDVREAKVRQSSKPRTSGHAQVQQNVVGFVLHGLAQSLFRVSSIEDFVAVREIYAKQTPKRFFVIGDQ